MKAKRAGAQSIFLNLTIAQLGPAVKKLRFARAFSGLFPGKSPSSATYCCYAGAALAISGVRNSVAHSSPDTLTPDIVSATLSRTERIDLLDGPLSIKDRVGQFEVFLKRVNISNGVS